MHEGCRRVLLAVAATGAFEAAPAAGQSSAVIYGRLYPELVLARTSGATAPGQPVATMQALPTGGRERVSALEASNSRLGLRGSEALGAGLEVIWQIEQAIAVDAGGGALASRDTFIGFKSDRLGTARLGNLDTVYKNAGDTVSFLGVSSGNFVSISNLLSKSNLSDTSAASFHLRRANSVVFESSERHGFGFAIQYSPDELRSAARNADLWSLGVTFDRGPLYLAAAYERHDDFFGGSRASRSDLRNDADPNARSRDEALRLTAQYRFGAHTLEANHARLRYRERGGGPGRFGEYASDRWSIAWDARWGGPWRTSMAYSGANDGTCTLLGGAACSTAGLHGHMIAAGAGYTLSRRTMLFAMAAHLANGRSALFNNAESLTPAVGARITQAAVGMLHSF